MKNPIFILLTILTFQLKAQDRISTQSDSLLQAIERTDDDSTKAHLYSQLKEIWQTKNFQKAVTYGRKGLGLARKTGNVNQQIGLSYQLAFAYMSIGNAPAAIDILQQLLPLVKDKNLDGYGTALAFIAMSYLKQQDYSNALKYMRMANALLPEMARRGQVLEQRSYLNCFTTMSEIFTKLNQPDSALHYGKIAYGRLSSEKKILPGSEFFNGISPGYMAMPIAKPNIGQKLRDSMMKPYCMPKNKTTKLVLMPLRFLWHSFLSKPISLTLPWFMQKGLSMVFKKVPIIPI